MEAAKMSRALIIFLLSLSTLNMANCDETEDLHLCLQSVTVSFTEEVPIQLEEFGGFEKYFKELGIPGGNKTVTKTRLEDKLGCCPGYIKSDGGDCVRLQTTTEATTKESQTTTEPTGSTPGMDQLSEGSGQQTQGGYLLCIFYTVLVIGILTIFGAVVCFLQNRKRKINNDSYRVNFEAEMEM